MRITKTITGAAILLSVFCVPFCDKLAANPTAIDWQGNLEQAMALSQNSGKPLFIHFYGDNCPPCKLMDREVFSAPTVIAALNRDFVVIKIHADSQRDVASKFDVKAIPTDIVLHSNGKLLHRRQGGITQDRFGQYLAFLLNELKKTTATSVSPRAQTPSPVTPPIPVPPATVNAAVATAADTATLRDPFTKQVVDPPPAATPTVDAVIPSTTSVAATLPVPPPLPIPQQTAPAVGVQTPVVSQPPPMPSAIPPTMPAEVPPMVAANPAPAIATQVTSPKLASAVEDSPKTTVEVPLALEGYCPVLLGKEEKWVPGNPAYYSMFRGHVFRFSSAAAMKEFEQSPQKFSPVAMGEDIVLMVDRNKRIYGSRKFGVWFQGRVFLFSNQESLDSFAERPEYYAEIATQYETAWRAH